MRIEIIEILNKMEKELHKLNIITTNDFLKGLTNNYSKYEELDKFKTYLPELYEIQETTYFSENERYEIKQLLKNYLLNFDDEVVYKNDFENKMLNDLIKY